MQWHRRNPRRAQENSTFANYMNGLFDSYLDMAYCLGAAAVAFCLLRLPALHRAATGGKLNLFKRRALEELLRSPVEWICLPFLGPAFESSP